LDSKFNLVAILRTAFRVIASPSGFFKEMPKTGGYIEPLVFMMVMGFVGTSLQAVFSKIGLQPVQLDIDAASLIMLLTFLIVASGFVAAAIYFIIWKLMGSHESFETAYRCNAYISALMPVTAVFNLVPYFGPVVTIALSTIFLVIASVRVHHLPPKKSWIVFGIFGLIFIMVMSMTEDIALKHLKGGSETQKQIEKIRVPPKEALKDLVEI